MLDGQLPIGLRRRALKLALIDLQRRLPALQILALVAVFAYGAATLPDLTSWLSIKTILVLASLTGLAALGQTFVILLGGFDLSIPGFMVASAYIVTTVKQTHHLPFGIALLIAVIVCGSLGGLSGQICHRFRVQPLIVTLGMGSALAGLLQATSGSASVGSAPQWTVQATSIRATTFGVGLPPVVVVWIAVALVATVGLHRTVAGRRLLATGADERAAEYSLINTRRVWTVTFAISGIVSVLAGLFVAGFAGNLDSAAATPYLFQSLVAVIVGGTVFGGPGDYGRTVIGAIFLTVVNVVIIGSGATPADQEILYGIVLAVAVSLYGRERRLRERV
jgi:ribose transport system permease protein